MSWEATLYSNWPCAGGTPIQDLGPLRAECAFEEVIDNSSPLQLAIDAIHFDACARRRVVRLWLEDGDTREFRIDQRRRRVGASGFTLEALPPIYDLRTSGLIRQRVGTRLITAFSQSGTIRSLLEGPFLWNAAADGLSWIDIGAVDFEETYLVEWQRLNRFEFAQRLRSETRGELALRKEGDDCYALSLRRAIGADAPPVTARFGDNLLELNEHVRDGDAVTVIAPFGVAEGDSGSYAGPAQNVWRVASVVSSAGGDWIELRDPETSALPFIADDQLVDYGVTWVGIDTTRRILAGMISTGRVQITGVAPALGTIVTLCQDDTGAPLETLSLRSGIAESGRVQADLEVPGARGERNLLANSAFADGLTGLTRTGGGGQPWGLYKITDTQDLAGELEATATAGASSIDVENFPANAVLRVGEYLTIVAAVLSIGTGGRTNADGELTVLLSAPTTFDLADGTVLQLRGPLNQNFGLATVDGTQLAGVTSLALRGLVEERPLAVTDDRVQLTVTAVTQGRVDATAFLFDDSSTPTSARYRLTLGGFGIDASILSTGFSRTVTWTTGATTWSATVDEDYVANSPTIVIRVTQAMVFSWVYSQYIPDADPFPGGSFFLRFENSRESTVRAITTAPGWDVNREATITVAGTWDIASTDDNDPPSVQRNVRIGFDNPIPGPTDFIALAPTASWSASDTTIELLAANGYNGDFVNPNQAYVGILPNASTLRADGQSVYVSAETTLDGTGSGTVPVSPNLPATSVAGSPIITRRCPDYRGGDTSGGSQVLFITGHPSGHEVRLLQATIPVAAGDVVTVQCKLWITAWSPLATGSVPILLRLTDAAWTTIEELAPDPDPTPILAIGGRGLPEFRVLTITHTLTTTTTLGVAVRAGGSGLGPHQAFVRAVMLAVGTDPEVPFTAGAFANVFVHASNDELRRSGRVVPNYTATLAAWDQAVAPIPDLAPGLLPRVTLGGTVIFDDVRDASGTPRVVRVVGQRRVPGRRDSQVTFGALDATDLAFTVGRQIGTVPGGR